MRFLGILTLYLVIVGVGHAETRDVEVGPNFQVIFRDTYTNTSETLIDVGDSVRWVWRSGFHTTTSYDGLWDAEISSVRRTFIYTFSEPGIYGYYCIPHESVGMTGVVRVRLPGDVDFSGCIDDADLLSVLFNFGATGARPEDVNYDRVVDDADLLKVLFNFGSGC